VTTSLVTGCAGFIGSNLVDRLLSLNHKVIGVDNYLTGRPEFLERAFDNKLFKFTELDLKNLADLKSSFKGVDVVYHLAANADVRFGLNHPYKDLEQNTINTYHVLEAMRENEVKKIVFSSTGSVYGEAQVIPTPEDAPFPIQTSLYGASKAAGEGLISAYCEGYGMQAWIYRFVSILGDRYTHGHVFDFYQKLIDDPTMLNVLGDGTQRKSYLYVQDCIDAILLGQAKAANKVNIFNLGVNGYCTVNDSIGWICSELGVSPKILYSGGNKGWVGDNPFIYLDTQAINSYGWAPKLSIKDGVVKTLHFLKQNPWLFQSAKS